MPSSTDRTFVGKTLRDEFRIDAEIGAGGMSRVFLAHQLSVDRPVVVKIMRPPSRRADEWRARFMQEARVASKVRHPGIVTIYSFGEEPDVGPYIAMELVEGDSLRDILMRDGPLAPHRACLLMAQVCRAMHAAHADGIVHRDLKPDNVMVEVRDEGEVARVLDFGVAKPADSVVNTLDEHIVGTPDYMAPEQSRKGAIDCRTDLYAAGIILFELIAGQRPYAAPDALTMMFKHHSEPLPIDRLPTPVADVLADTFAHACAKAPSDRFANAKEMAEALDLAAARLDDAPASPPTAATPEPVPATLVAERHAPTRWPLAALAATAVLAVAAVLLASRPDPEPAPPPPPIDLIAPPREAVAPPAPPSFAFEAARLTVATALGSALTVSASAAPSRRPPRKPRPNGEPDFHRVQVPDDRPEILTPFED